MISNKNQPSNLSFFYSVGLFMIGITLFYSKLDSKENNVKPVQYTGLICILSSSVSIFMGMITWIRALPTAEDTKTQDYLINNERLTSPNGRDLENKNTSTLNDEDSIDDNFNIFMRKSFSAPTAKESSKKSLNGKNVDEASNNISPSARPCSSNN